MTQKKKKQMTTIVALVVALLVICIAYFAVVKKNEAKEKAADTSVNVLQLNSSDAVKLEISNENGDLVFEKKSGLWKLEGDDEFEVKTEVIQTILDDFADLTATKSVSNTKENLADYGLDKPSTVGTLTLSDGTSATVSLGAEVPIIGGYYGMLDGTEEIYTFAEETLENLSSSKNDFEYKGVAITVSPEA